MIEDPHIAEYEKRLDAVVASDINPIEPHHYTELAISPLEYIKANDFSWNVGNVIKYVSRYKNKNGIEDLQKASWYLQNLIEDLEDEAK